MAFDDAAWDSENPFQGELYNVKDGLNYYEGCQIDYKGESVSRANFEAVLRGEADKVNTTGEAKVLQTNVDSKIFLYFADHGAPGHLMFPDSSLFADELNATLQHMYANGRYKELVMFIEACESGSLFAHIDLESIGAYALTATNATAPSYGTFCYPHDMVKGQNLYSCLGDLFSVSWMDYLTQNKKVLSEKSMKSFYEEIKKRTVKSEVMAFGSQSIAEKPVSDVFKSDAKLLGRPDEAAETRLLTAAAAPEPSEFLALIAHVNARDTYLHHLYSKALVTHSRKVKIDLMNHYNHMMKTDEAFAQFLDTAPHKLQACKHFNSDQKCIDQFIPKDFDCLRFMIRTFEEECGKFT